MPAKLAREHDGGFMTYTSNKVHGRHMSEKNAKSQVRLLNALEHNPEFAKKLKRKH